MNQLFLKKRVENIFITLIILVFSIPISAEDSIPDLTFVEHCINSDAYLLYSYTDVSFSKSWVNYEKIISVQSKLVVNNKSGVEKYAFLNLNNFTGKNIERIIIKTYKADGTIVELDSDLVFEHLSDDEQFGQIDYPIPGVEPGDTIVTDYVITEIRNNYELNDFVNLFSPVPSMNTEFSVSIPPDLHIIYKPYNGFPEPQVISNDTLIYCLFKMEKVKGFTENIYSCLPCELPYLYYSIDKKDSELRTWKDVYNQEFNIVTQPIKMDRENSSYYNRWKKE